MTFEEALAFLEARIRYGMRPGLERIAALLEALGHPQRSYPSIHVTGTNGKYSVVAMAAAILTELGLTVGSYTSPHLEDVRERIGVGGEAISEEGFASVLGYLAPYVELVERELGEALTYFETLTAMAFEHFFDVPVHAAVVEVGLGGEYDATNLVHARVAVLTKVARDHLQEFGDDLGRAAWEKAGIIKEGATVLSGVEQPELARVVEARAAERGAERLAVAGRDFGVAERRVAVGGQLLRIRGLYGEYEDLYLPLHGAHQATNAAFAVAACEAFRGCALDPEAVAQALGSVRAPGRLEVVGRHPLVVVDGGHNADAAQAVVRTLQAEFAFDRMTAVVGMLDDKPVEEVLGVLAPAADRFVLTAPEAEERRPPADPSRLQRALREAGVEERRMVVREPLAEAVQDALAGAGEGDLVLVFGSFYTAGQARAALRRLGSAAQA